MFNDRFIPNALNIKAEELVSALCNDKEIAVRFGSKYEGALPNRIAKKGDNLLLTITVRNRRIALVIDYKGNIIESPNDGFNETRNDTSDGYPDKDVKACDNLCTEKNDNQLDKPSTDLTTKGSGLDLPDQKCHTLEKVLGPGPKHFAARLCYFGTIEFYVENSVDTESETCIRRFTPISIERALDSADNSLILKNAEGQTLTYDPETKKGSLLT